MKIDIHTHTKKIKQGDSESRNINVENFIDIINKTEVKILAITNHNHFDFEQYEMFKYGVDGVCQIWPGIELDVVEEERKAHLIVIVNPINAKKFESRINDIIGSTSPDSFNIDIDLIASSFNDLDPIFIAHYYSKTPNLIDKDLDKLLGLIPNPKRVLKEASNSISAGIYISHGHKSIYGSDVQNWDEYILDSIKLPELRLPVESFEQFCLLLEKDDNTINTILNKTTKDQIEISPFGDSEKLIIDIYNDINILFGSKGTGKSEILKSLSTHFNGKGYKTEVYESGKSKLEDVFDLKGLHFTFDADSANIDPCIEEISFIRNAVEKSVSSISSYTRFYSDQTKNKIAKKIKIQALTLEDASVHERNTDEIFSFCEKIDELRQYTQENKKINELVGGELAKKFEVILTEIYSKLFSEYDNSFTKQKSVSYLNKIIQVFAQEISRKTGKAIKPTQTGFREFASNRIAIEKAINKIKLNLNSEIAPKIDEVGNLGEKGKLFCQTNIKIQNGTISNSDYRHINSRTKDPQKQFTQQLETILNHVYSEKLFEKIDELNNIESSDTINSINDLVLFYRHFTLNGNNYNPSSGESLMVLLHNELIRDKEIYLIDEPEKSLGNDYISEVIVPLIKEKAKSGKKVIIATHDANIAVRTLPYNSIYRLHNINQTCFTFVGNPFSNNLKCINGSENDLDWKSISMKTLEGGRSAFGERGRIYGNVQS
jgi:predicted ATPase